MTKPYPAVILALFCVPLVTAGDDKPADPAAKIKTKLIISVEEYDPFTPSKGVVKCVVVNGSSDPVEVPIGYDGRVNRLMGHGEGHRFAVTLYPFDPPKEEPKRVTVKPGEEHVAFELSLDVILFQGAKDEPPQGKNRKWRWDWIARPESPPSPIHRWRQPGFLEKATFWAEVGIGDKKLASEKVVLKVKPGGPERK